MSIEITVIISIATALLGAVLGVAGYHRTTKKEASTAGHEGGALMADMAYVKVGIDDIKREQREQTKTNLEVVARIVAVEASTKQAHKRLDTFEGKIYPGM